MPVVSVASHPSTIDTHTGTGALNLLNQLERLLHGVSICAGLIESR